MQHLVPLESGRVAPHGDAVQGPAVPANALVEVTVVLRENPRRPSLRAELEALAAEPPGRRRYIDAVELETRFGVAPEDLRAVTRMAARSALRVVAVDRGSREIRLEGRASQVERAFGVHLHEFRTAGGDRYRGFTEAHPSIPAGVAHAVAGVLGLDTRPALRQTPMDLVEEQLLRRLTGRDVHVASEAPHMTRARLASERRRPAPDPGPGAVDLVGRPRDRLGAGAPPDRLAGADHLPAR